jgi:hypothetical protein
MSLRPDYATDELLYGLRGSAVEVDWDTLVTVDDVALSCLGNPQGIPPPEEARILAAIDAAINYVSTYLASGLGFA